MEEEEKSEMDDRTSSQQPEDIKTGAENALESINLKDLYQRID